MDQNDFTIEKNPEKMWMVVKTKPRCEKKFSEYCTATGITHYLPLRRSVKRYQNKRVEFMIPMFGGYVFAQINPESKILLLKPFHSAQIITPDLRMEEKLIQELNDIKTLINATSEGKIFVRPEIQIGKCVRIKTGAMAGLCGIVTRRNTQVRITVNVEMVGYSVSVDTDVGGVEIDF